MQKSLRNSFGLRTLTLALVLLVVLVISLLVSGTAHAASTAPFRNSSQARQATPSTSPVGCSGSYDLKVTTDSGSVSCYSGVGSLGVSIYGNDIILQTRSHSVDFCGYNWVNGAIPVPYCAHVNANSTWISKAALPYSALQINSISIN